MGLMDSLFIAHEKKSECYLNNILTGSELKFLKATKKEKKRKQANDVKIGKPNCPFFHLTFVP